MQGQGTECTKCLDVIYLRSRFWGSLRANPEICYLLRVPAIVSTTYLPTQIPRSTYLSIYLDKPYTIRSRLEVRVESTGCCNAFARGYPTHPIFVQVAIEIVAS